MSEVAAGVAGTGTTSAGTVRYRRPADDVVTIVEASPTPVVVMSPDARRLLFGHYDALPSIAQQAEPMLGLAGVRFRPRLNEWHRAYYFTRLEIQDIESGERRTIDTPDGARLGRPLFATDGRTLAFTRTVDDGVELWAADVASGRAWRVLRAILNDVFGGAFAWVSDRRELIVLLVPEGRGDAPTAPLVPVGPVVEDTSGKQATNRTFQDLLKNSHDEALFEHYCKSQCARVKLDGEAARVSMIGSPAIFLELTPSPDGASILVERAMPPWSYSVPISRFAHTIEVWSDDGESRVEIARLPVAEEIPIQGVSIGPRAVHWQPHEPATLCFAQALDGGDPRRAAEHRDELFRLPRPFEGGARAASPFCRVQQRFIGIEWLEREGRCFVSEWDRDRRWVTTTLRDAKDPATSRVIFDRSQNDHYGDPGDPVLKRTRQNTLVVRMDGDAIFLSGSGATPDGDLPFLDRLDLATLEKHRLYQSERERYSHFLQFVPGPAGDYSRFILRRESRTEPPNFFLRDVAAGAESERALTDFPDPHPQLTGIRKDLLTYRRSDGIALSGTLYTPASHREGERLPLVVWAYPLEYNDAGTAGQVTSQPNRFTRLSGISPLFFLLAGYAVLDEATVPIVGDPEKVNDTFVKQCVDSAAAAIDACVDRGVVDRDRVAVGGHSYGAFMTATLLAHSTLFKAGLARSGAYNRTLTPFGFQGERRTLWEARETYLAMSPLLLADRIKAPLLLIHGEIDENPGTHTLQTKRLFHALQGLGATARMVLLPHESHGYVAKESVLHVLAESIDWLKRYV